MNRSASSSLAKARSIPSPPTVSLRKSHGRSSPTPPSIPARNADPRAARASHPASRSPHAAFDGADTCRPTATTPAWVAGRPPRQVRRRPTPVLPSTRRAIDGEVAHMEQRQAIPQRPSATTAAASPRIHRTPQMEDLPAPMDEVGNAKPRRLCRPGLKSNSGGPGGRGAALWPGQSVPGVIVPPLDARSCSACFQSGTGRSSPTCTWASTPGGRHDHPETRPSVPN